MLDCLRFRRRLLIDPWCQDPDLLRHVAHCPRCTRAAKRAFLFESKLRAALEQEYPATAGGRGAAPYPLE